MWSKKDVMYIEERNENKGRKKVWVWGKCNRT